MNFLIVDDEPLLLNDIMASVNWAECGAESIHTANNIIQAKEIITNRKVDILLCDIEMPKGSGLDLLEWIRDNRLGIHPIIMTCHADFHYAQRALKLGSLDYVLKPIDYDELDLSIKKAGARINRLDSLTRYSQYGKFWAEYQPIAVNRFWLGVLNNRYHEDSEKRMMDASLEVPVDANMRIFPILLSVRKWNEESVAEGRRRQLYFINKLAAEMISGEGMNVIAVELAHEHIALLLIADQNRFELETVRKQCVEYIEYCSQNLSCEMIGYLGKACDINALPLTVDKLREMDKDNCSGSKGVYIAEIVNLKENSMNFPMEIWLALLEQERYEELLEQANEILMEPALRQSFISASGLRSFFYSFLQMLYIFYNKTNILPLSAIENDLSLTSDDPANSVENMMTWMRRVLDSTREAINADRQRGIVDRVRIHIEDNLLSDDSRVSIATAFFINPDYLDRLFKRETGLSVKKYIFQKRMEYAENLLRFSDIPISNIAMQLGYKNMSHFSSAFKKVSGLNPTSFRHGEKRNGEQDL